MSLKPPVRRLIMTADDFGLSPEVNAGVIRAFTNGVLTATSLMVAGAAHQAAAALAGEHRRLDVGLHIVVCRGHSVLAPDYLGSIVDAASLFAANPTLAGMNYFFNRKIRDRLRDELRAQIERHLQLIGSLTHLDGHLNFHVHPTIANILIQLSAEYRIRCMRLPHEPLFTTLRLARRPTPRVLAESVIFGMLSRRMAAMMREHGIRTSDRLFGLHQTGHLSEDYVVSVINALPPGVTEMYFHPALDAGNAPVASAAQHEVQILTSDRIGAAITNSLVQLTSFAELVRS